jgi:hypothetical protein
MISRSRNLTPSSGVGGRRNPRLAPTNLAQPPKPSLLPQGLQGQLADLGVQWRQVQRGRALAAACEDVRGALQYLPLPLNDLAGVQLEFLAQLGHSLVVAQGRRERQRHRCLETSTRSGTNGRCCSSCASRGWRWDEILAFLSERVAKWWVPDDVVFLESLPVGGTGKVQKADLRKQYGGVFS